MIWFYIWMMMIWFYIRTYMWSVIHISSVMSWIVIMSKMCRAFPTMLGNKTMMWTMNKSMRLNMCIRMNIPMVMPYIRIIINSIIYVITYNPVKIIWDSVCNNGSICNFSGDSYVINIWLNICRS